MQQTERETASGNIKLRGLKLKTCTTYLMWVIIILFSVYMISLQYLLKRLFEDKKPQLYQHRFVQKSALLEIAKPAKNEKSACLIANMPSIEELEMLAKGSTLPGPVINVGFPKGGSTTLHSFFQCGGWKSNHYYRCGITKKELCGVCMQNSVAKGLPPISSCSPNPREPMSKQAFTQLDASYPTRCVWPQIDSLDEIHRDVPNATFILGMRDFDHWYASVSKWQNGNYRRRLLTCNLANLTTDATTMEGHTENFKIFFCSHVERIRRFVSEHPSHTLVELDIENPKAGFIMSNLFGIHESCWAHENKSGTNQKQNRNENEKRRRRRNKKRRRRRNKKRKKNPLLYFNSSLK